MVGKLNPRNVLLEIIHVVSFNEILAFFLHPSESSIAFKIMDLKSSLFEVAYRLK